MSQIVLQTPIPASGSEVLIAIAVLSWILGMFLLTRRFGKTWKLFGEIGSFLLYMLGLLFLVILLF
jgi:hypothetical protein